MLHSPRPHPGPSTHLGSRGHHGRTTLAFSSGLGVTFLSPSRGHTGCLRPPPSPRPPHPKAPKACLPPSQPVPPLVSLPTLLHSSIPAPACLPPHRTAAGGSSGTGSLDPRAFTGRCKGPASEQYLGMSWPLLPAGPLPQTALTACLCPRGPHLQEEKIRDLSRRPRLFTIFLNFRFEFLRPYMPPTFGAQHTPSSSHQAPLAPSRGDR